MPDYTSFDQRTVRYEEIHSIGSRDFDALIEAAEIRDGYLVMDCGCGYGAVTRELLKRSSLQANEYLAVDLVDESEYQLNRARRELENSLPDAKQANLQFIHASFPADFSSRRRYDVIFAKMVLHEVPRDKQHDFILGLYEHLKNPGRLLLWDVCLSPVMADFYRQVIRKKDRLAGFHTMVSRRHFLSALELAELFRGSPFTVIDLVAPITYRFESLKRLGPELQGRRDLLQQLNDAIRAATENLDSSAKADLSLTDDGENVTFQIKKGIFLAVRSDKLLLSINPFRSQVPGLSSSPEPVQEYPSIMAKSIEDWNLGRIVGEQRGLVRVSVLTRGYDGQRQLCREGLDYLYHYRDHKARDRHAYAYLAYLTWLYWSAKEVSGGGGVRSLSGALSCALSDTAGSGWLRSIAADDGRLKVTVGSPGELCASAVLTFPRLLKVFFDEAVGLFRSAVELNYEEVREGDAGWGLRDTSVVRVRAGTGQSLDTVAQQYAETHFVKLRGLAKKVAAEPVEIEMLHETVRMKRFLASAIDLLLPLDEYLRQAGARSCHHVAPPSLGTLEASLGSMRSEDGVVVLSSEDPLGADSLEGVLLYAAGLWSGIGSVESLIMGKQREKATQLAARGLAIAGFTHQVSHVLGGKSGVSPLYEFAQHLLEHRQAISEALCCSEDIPLRAAQVSYASILPGVFADSIVPPEPTHQRGRMWDGACQIHELVDQIWCSLVLPCARAASVKNAKFGCRGREAELDWAPTPNAVILVPANDLVRAMLFEVLWNACRHGDYSSQAPGKAVSQVAIQPLRSAVALSVSNPTNSTGPIVAPKHLQSFAGSLGSWTSAPGHEDFSVKATSEGGMWTTILTLPIPRG